MQDPHVCHYKMPTPKVKINMSEKNQLVEYYLDSYCLTLNLPPDFFFVVFRDIA